MVQMKPQYINPEMFFWCCVTYTTMPNVTNNRYKVSGQYQLDCVRNMMAHAQKSDFVFRRKGRVHLNRRGRQFSRLVAAEVCASAVVMIVMLDTPCSEVV